MRLVEPVQAWGSSAVGGARRATASTRAQLDSLIAVMAALEVQLETVDGHLDSLLLPPEPETGSSLE